MEFSFLGYILYGLVVGFSEFLPVSSSGNGYMVSLITGMTGHTPLLDFFVHAGCLGALVILCGGRLLHTYQQMRLASVPSTRRRRPLDRGALRNSRLLISAMPVAVVLAVLGTIFLSRLQNLPFLILVSIANGILVYIPQFYPGGNRDSRGMERKDSLWLGLCSGIGILPGFSRMGLCLAVGQLRGCDKEYLLDLCLMLLALTMPVLMVLDLVLFIASGFAGLSLAVFGTCILAAGFAFVAGCGAILLMRFLAQKSGFSIFGYYSWGLAMFSFILYLIT